MTNESTIADDTWAMHLDRLERERKREAVKRAPDGLHRRRIEDESHSPIEAAFRDAWRQQHEFQDLLDQLLRVPCSGTDAQRITGQLGDELGQHWKQPLGEATERDRVVAATVVQWIGSNCGMSFLREALSQAGYELPFSPTKKEQ